MYDVRIPDIQDACWKHGQRTPYYIHFLISLVRTWVDILDVKIGPFVYCLSYTLSEACLVDLDTGAVEGHDNIIIT